MEFEFVKIVVFAPVEAADELRRVLAESGCGKMGNYEACSFSLRGVGRFRPLDGADPAIGEVGKLEEVEEERIETICKAADLERVLTAVKEAHPYEEPAYDVLPLLNL